MKIPSKIVDLTHTITPYMPVWPGGTRFSSETLIDYDEGVKVISIAQGTGIGTHMDSPAHFIKGGKTITDYGIESFNGPACVIDVREQVAGNSDYNISAQDLIDWESENGEIPEGAYFLALTGWSQYWDSEARYRNADEEGRLHFPGFSEKAAGYLVQRKVTCVGIDTLSIDPGVESEFPAHKVILGAGLMQLENLTNLEQLPATGALLLSLPIKILEAPEAPARVIALLPSVG